MRVSGRKSEGIPGAWVWCDVFHGASCGRTSWAAIGASGGGALTAHPSKAATTHASPVATASAITTSRRFSRLMGGSMLDISVPDIADGRCTGCDQLRDRDGIAGAIGHDDRRQLLTYRDYIIFADSESPEPSPPWRICQLPLPACQAGIAVAARPRIPRGTSCGGATGVPPKKLKNILGGTGPVLPVRRNSQHSRARCGQIAPSHRNYRRRTIACSAPRTCMH